MTRVAFPYHLVPKVVCSARMKAESHITGDTKTQVTVLACTSASGYVLPPFIIFDRKDGLTKAFFLIGF